MKEKVKNAIYLFEVLLTFASHGDLVLWNQSVLFLLCIFSFDKKPPQKTGKKWTCHTHSKKKKKKKKRGKL